MCEFYNLDEVKIGYVPPTKKNNEPIYHELKSGDIISLNFKGLMGLFSIPEYIGKFKFLGKDWAYKSHYSLGLNCQSGEYLDLIHINLW